MPRKKKEVTKESLEAEVKRCEEENEFLLGALEAALNGEFVKLRTEHPLGRSVCQFLVARLASPNGGILLEKWSSPDEPTTLACHSLDKFIRTFAEMRLAKNDLDLRKAALEAKELKNKALAKLERLEHQGSFRHEALDRT